MEEVQSLVRNYKDFIPSFNELHDIRENIKCTEEFSENIQTFFFPSIISEISSKIDNAESEKNFMDDVSMLSSRLFVYIFFINKVDKENKEIFNKEVLKIYNRLIEKSQYITYGRIKEWSVRYYVVCISLLVIEENATQAMKFAINEVGRSTIADNKDTIAFFMQELLNSNSILIQYNIDELYSSFKEINQIIQETDSSTTETIIHKDEFIEEEGARNPFHLKKKYITLGNDQKNHLKISKYVCCPLKGFVNYDEILFPKYHKL